MVFYIYSDEVEDEFHSLIDGSFVVFRCESDRSLAQHTYMLVVKVNGSTVFKPILSDDDRLFGFIKPHTFESIEEVLRAYNDSQTETGGRLVYPGLTYKTGMDISQADAIVLLKRLLDLRERKIQQTTELANRNRELQDLEKELSDCNKRTKAYSTVHEMLKYQKIKHTASQSGASNQKDVLVKFSENYQKILDRQLEVTERQTETEGQIANLQAAYSRASALYSQSLEAVNCTNLEQEHIRRSLSVSARMADYIECIIANNGSLYLAKRNQVTWYSSHEWEKKYAHQLLNGKPDGTFLVSPNSKPADVPYILSVAYEGQDTYFKVLMRDGYLGLVASTCIFSDICHLVHSFSTLPFGDISEQYSKLKLTFPALSCRNSVQNS